MYFLKIVMNMYENCNCNIIYLNVFEMSIFCKYNKLNVF